MRTSKFWLVSILLQTVTLFFLGILGNQIATLFQLPPYLLIAITFVGLVTTVVVTYLIQRPVDESPDEDELSWSEILRRLRSMLRRRRYMFGSRRTIKQVDRLISIGVYLTLILGALAALIRKPLNDIGHSGLWWGILLAFSLICLIPINMTGISVSPPSLSERIVDFLSLFLLVGILMSIGLVAGFVICFLTSLVLP